ncbi:MAG: C45 family peptidase [archaeon]|nr:C45 family peptidase [archaeon]
MSSSFSSSTSPPSFHSSYVELETETHFEMGLKLGQLLGPQLRRLLTSKTSEPGWPARRQEGVRRLALCDRDPFRGYLLELQGYALAARVCFEDLWTAALEDDLGADRCTSLITNDGQLVGHNEDWDAEAQNSLFVLRRTVAGFTVLELFYFYTMGGGGASVNSAGVVQIINSLCHRDHREGTPGALLARRLSETADPQADYASLIQSSDGGRGLCFSHTFAKPDGGLFNIETSSLASAAIQPSAPFVHANHYLIPEMQQFEATTNSTHTLQRYSAGIELVRPHMEVDELLSLLSDTSAGPTASIFNERTIGRVVFDRSAQVAKIWLRREAERGWVDYPFPVKK